MTEDIQQWGDKAMYAAEPMDGTTPRVYLLSATPDPLGAIAAACMMYEGKVCRNINRDVNDEMRRYYWDNIKKTHLKAPLEFVDFHFMIEGVTRAFTHQMVRQRTAVYAQESLRFAVKEDIAEAVALPPSLVGTERTEDLEARGDHHLIDNQRMVWDKAVAAVDEAYTVLVNMGVPAEDARGLLPTNITTRLNYKTNLRNLLEHAGNRLCTQAQFEWRQVFTALVEAIANYEGVPLSNNPGASVYVGNAWQFQHIAHDSVFAPICYSLGRCQFNADFDRDCSIRGRVEEGKFDEIDPREWLLDAAAARRG